MTSHMCVISRNKESCPLSHYFTYALNLSQGIFNGQYVERITCLNYMRLSYKLTYLFRFEKQIGL